MRTATPVALSAAGMNGVVSKPFSPAGLLAEIARLTHDETARAAAG